MSFSPSLRLSVRLSVPGRHYTRMAKCRITQTALYESPGILVFSRQKYRRKSDRVTSNGAPNRCGVGSNRRFSKKISRCISKTILWNANGGSYTLSNGAIFSDLQEPLATRNHLIFNILYRVSYLRSGWT